MVRGRGHGGQCDLTGSLPGRKGERGAPTLIAVFQPAHLRVTLKRPEGVKSLVCGVISEQLLWPESKNVPANLLARGGGWGGAEAAAGQDGAGVRVTRGVKSGLNLCL